jgi:hypothetical protein
MKAAGINCALTVTFPFFREAALVFASNGTDRVVIRGPTVRRCQPTP